MENNQKQQWKETKTKTNENFQNSSQIPEAAYCTPTKRRLKEKHAVGFFEQQCQNKKKKKCSGEHCQLLHHKIWLCQNFYTHSTQTEVQGTFSRTFCTKWLDAALLDKALGIKRSVFDIPNISDRVRGCICQILLKLHFPNVMSCMQQDQTH